MTSPLIRSLALLAIGMMAFAVQAQEKILNIYSARHYPTDEALYSDFTKATGIRIQRVDADDAGILARLKAEGAASPADVILLVDASRLWRAETDGLFLPVKSAKLEMRFLRICGPPRPRTVARLGLACPRGHVWWCTTKPNSPQRMWTAMKNWLTPNSKANSAFDRAHIPTT